MACYFTFYKVDHTFDNSRWFCIFSNKQSSTVEQKRKILSFVFSNLYLEGENIRYELNKPFDKLVNMVGCKDWWSIGDSNS